MEYMFGFYSQGVKGRRVPCRVVDYWKHALTAPVGVTGKEDFYLSAFTFGTDFVEHLKTTGSTGGFSGACGADVLWFDIDREELPVALEDTRRLVEYLVCGVPFPVPESFSDANEQFDFHVPPVVSEDGILIFFSGSKGFHVGVPLAGAEPCLDFHKQAKAVAVSIAAGAKVKIDTAIYDRSRLFRCPNTRHLKTGLYKIPLTYLECTTFWTLEMILEKAKVPRGMEPFSDALGVSWPGLASRFGDVATVWKGAGVGSAKTEGEHPSRLRRDTFDFIRHGAEKGMRNNRLFQAVCDCIQNGWSRRAVDSLFVDVARKTGLSLEEIRNTLDSAFQQGVEVTE
ncbi:MAG: hypothetical protein Q4D98_07145 [Planctomycetia bacterium]|nr:hypothetical protein [Planctomycetia bacterium]